jgi:uncharacterized protein YidB (DUF937 family)
MTCNRHISTSLTKNHQEAIMGLLDILNGMQNGPRGQRQPSTRDGGGGMSPMMMALLALLAYKALKGSGNRGYAPGAGQPAPVPPGTVASANPTGGLGDILGGLLGGRAGGAASGGSLGDLMKDGLGGLLGGAAAGSVLSGGLGNLVKELQDRGHGNVTQSWIGTGPNNDIAPNDLEHALGSETLDTLTQQTGMSRADLLAGLSEHLPDLVDQLRPNGRLPTEEEAARMV